MSLHDAGIDFAPASDVTLDFSNIDNVDMSVLHALNIDHLDYSGATLDITEDEAAAAVHAGVDIVEGDNVVLHADGTHLSTSLKDLQSLHVDTIQLSAHSMMINAGGSLGSLSTADLPHIVGHDAGVGGASFDPDVTLTVDPGTLPDSTDISGIAHGLAAAGIDHIGVGGDGNLSLSFAQATAATDAGLNFAQDAHITVNLEASQIGTLTGEPGIGDMGIDHLHVQGGVAEITDAEASTLVDAGVDFVGSDSITLHADQTHLSTSLKGLQDLHVDSIKVDAGVTQLHVDAGDLSGLTASSLPQFDVAQTDASLDVTLRLDASQLDKLDDLAAALRAAGIDHFAVDQPIGDYDAATQAHMATITQESGINFVYEPEPAHTMHTELFSATMEPQDGAGDDHALLQQLLSTFESHEDHGTGGQVVLEDGSINALAEAGMLRAYTADEVVLDGTHSGETLLTTLKQIADFGIDHIIATPSGGPLLVDAGSLSGADGQQVKDLFDALDANVQTKGSIFDGVDHVALVVDQDLAHAISEVDGGFEKLASIGFTQLDVLMAAGDTSPVPQTDALEVKVIGEDDDQYWRLHHDR